MSDDWLRPMGIAVNATTGTQANTNPRACTCHPDDATTPCAHKFAARDCKISDVARRIRYAADMVGDDELPSQLNALARELENLVN